MASVWDSSVSSRLTRFRPPSGMAPAQPGVITNGLFSLGPRWLAFASRESAPPTIVSLSHSSCALPEKKKAPSLYVSRQRFFNFYFPCP